MARTLHDLDTHAFASDNYSGAHPKIMQALAAANGGHQISYGEDAYTARLDTVVREQFGRAARAYPVLTGTGANVIALEAMLPRWGAVICADTAHINTDENAAPERMAGLKLLTVPTPDGKLTPELIDRQAWGWGFEPRAQPLAVSITQSTELGTTYSLDELQAITDHAHGLGMTVHMDGARLANAAAHNDTTLAAMTSEAGIDVLSFGGTKNGLMFGELIVTLNDAAVNGGAASANDADGAGGGSAASTLGYLRKLNAQLASKMRFISAQFVELLETDLWRENAAHANAMATRLRSTLDAAITNGEAPGLAFTQATQANALFASMPPAAADDVREQFRFYDWNATTNEVRWMCSWDTTEAHVDAFTHAVCAALRP